MKIEIDHSDAPVPHAHVVHVSPGRLATRIKYLGEVVPDTVVAEGAIATIRPWPNLETDPDL